MPSYVAHLATAQEYLRKHNREFSQEFMLGSIEPDFLSWWTKEVWNFWWLWYNK